MEMVVELTKRFENWLENEKVPETYVAYYVTSTSHMLPAGPERDARDRWGWDEALKNFRLAKSQYHVPIIHFDDPERIRNPNVIASLNKEKEYEHRVRIWGARTEDNKSIKKYWVTSDFDGCVPRELQEAIILWMKDIAPNARSV